MRKILLLSILFLLSCSEEIKPEGEGNPHFLHSYIVEYVEGDWQLRLNSKSVENGLGLNIDTYYGNYVSLDVNKESEESAAKFLEIATRNNDLTYDRMDIWLNYNSRVCPADQFRRIRIRCPHRDWDEMHPAGVDLGDIVTIEILSYADYVKNGYVGDEYKEIKKKVADVTENDLTMFVVKNNCPILYFDKYPALSGYYTLEVTLETVDQKEYKAYCTINFP